MRVHPELLANEALDPARAQDPAFWQERLKDIAAWERHLTRSGTRIVKLFLHVSQASSASASSVARGVRTSIGSSRPPMCGSTGIGMTISGSARRRCEPPARRWSIPSFRNPPPRSWQRCGPRSPSCATRWAGACTLAAERACPYPRAMRTGVSALIDGRLQDLIVARTRRRWPVLRLVPAPWIRSAVKPTAVRLRHSLGRGVFALAPPLVIILALVLR